jgi:hypothetical protein
VDAAGTSVGDSRLRLGVVAALTGLALLGPVACSSGGPGRDSAASSSTGVPSAAGTCWTPTPDEEGAFDADASGGAVNALVSGSLPPRTDSELKIVWRVTGEGEPTVSAERPDGSAGVLTFGPEAHPASNFDRPGDEWGTGFRFDMPGCWHLDVRRGAVHARVPIRVVG